MKNVILFIALFLTILFGCKQSQQETDIIAQVGERTLTVRELSDEIPHQLQSSLKESEIKEYVLRWINKEVLYQEALSRKLDQRVDFKRELENLQRELLINKLLEVAVDSEPVTISNEEIRALYDQSGDEFTLNDDVVHCYHILCRSREEANDIRSRLTQGASFEEIILGMNQDSLTFKNWDLGYFTRDQIIPEISKVVFNLPVGSVSNPIKSDYGYHILKVLDKRNKGQKKNLSEVEDEIRLKLMELRRQESYERFLLETKNKYSIQSNFQLLDSLTTDSLANKGAR